MPQKEREMDIFIIFDVCYQTVFLKGYIDLKIYQ